VPCANVKNGGAGQIRSEVTAVSATPPINSIAFVRLVFNCIWWFKHVSNVLYVCLCTEVTYSTGIDTISGITAPDPVSVLGSPLYRVSHITRSSRVAIVQRSQGEETSGLTQDAKAATDDSLQ
jgi:hypothetical protein